MFTYDGVGRSWPRRTASRRARPTAVWSSCRASRPGCARRRPAGAYSAEEADTLGTQAQQQAEAIAGQLTQAAAKLNIELEEG